MDAILLIDRNIGGGARLLFVDDFAFVLKPPRPPLAPVVVADEELSKKWTPLPFSHTCFNTSDEVFSMVLTSSL